MSNPGTEHLGTGAPPDDEIRRVMEDFQHHTLDKMPGRFHRLVYLSSLRDHNTGRYNHYGLEQRYSQQAVDEALGHCHERAFDDLLTLTLRDQTQDLIHFFESLKEERACLVEVWQQLQAYQVLPPQSSSPLARQMFSKNVEVILQILKESDLWELLNDPHCDPDDLP